LDTNPHHAILECVFSETNNFGRLSSSSQAIRCKIQTLSVMINIL